MEKIKRMTPHLAVGTVSAFCREQLNKEVNEYE